MNTKDVELVVGQERLFQVAELDRRLAFIVVGAPTLGVVAALILAIYGLPPTSTALAMFAIFYVLTMVGIECGFHRLFAHKSFKTSAFFESLLAIFGSMAFQGPVIWWAATHRRHHQCADAEGDPHSPYVTSEGEAPSKWHGLWHSHIGWLFIQQSTRPKGWATYVKDLYKREHLFTIHMGYFGWLLLGFAIPTVVGALVDGGWQGALLGFVWGGLVRAFFVHHFIWSLNSFCHLFGQRPFRLRNDFSHNILWLALPTFGQGWHNNHHAFPASAKVGFKWWQFDMTWWFLKTLSWFGIVWDLRTAEPELIKTKMEAALCERGELNV